jgi:hypothetical protein
MDRMHPTPDKVAARAQLIRMLAERLVRDAQQREGKPDDSQSHPVRQVQHRQAARIVD